MFGCLIFFFLPIVWKEAEINLQIIFRESSEFHSMTQMEKRICCNVE